MKNRIREVRKSLGMNQTDFGRALGASLSAASKWESGENAMSDATIMLLCQKFGVSEAWLRTGAGEMYADKTREELITEEVTRMMATAPDSFKAALIAALLRFDPDGPEWTILEDVYNSVAAELAENPPKE